MFKYISILIAALHLSLQAWGASRLPREQCLPIVRDFEAISNVSPKEVEAKAPGVLDKLRDGESLTCYFIAYNIYVENLFNQGKIDKARRELDAMVNEALSQDNPECQTIALRTQGQFYYKLGLYDRAAESFDKAMEICPHYDSERLESYFTWSSTLFWLIHSQMQLGNVDEAERWLLEMDDMMRWLDSKGIVDQIGYKPVMMLGLKSKIALQRGDIANARDMLGECHDYMLPDIPLRAYVDYYEGELMLAVNEGRAADAIPLLDQLIDIHINDYMPIAANFLHQKADLLYDLGRYEESAQTFRRYEDLQSQVDAISIAQQLDELTMRYDVEKLQHERDQMRNDLILSIIICIALSIIVAVIAISQNKSKKKNIVLAKNISNLHQLSKQKVNQTGNTATVVTATDGIVPEIANAATDSATETAKVSDNVVESAQDQDPDRYSNPEYIATGNLIIDYIKTSKCYLSANCGRQTIKEALGVSEQLLSKAVPLVTGVTFVNYINRLRMDYAIDLLDNHPEMTINKISTACGFGTLRQFQRIFKQYYELTPSAYREARALLHDDKSDIDDDME